jgi:uncharacterized membrane protein
MPFMKYFLIFIDKIDRRFRLMLSFVLGILIFMLTNRPGNEGLDFLYAWIGFASTSLFFSWVTILVRHPRNIGRIAKKQDSSFWLIFLIVVTASTISLFTIILLLKDLPKFSKSGLSLHIVLSMTAVMLSWLLIHTLFTIRYAHLYYDPSSRLKKEKNPQVGGLLFPGNQAPDFMDFAYFSFVLGMTFQVSDVNITNSFIRRLALFHGLLSFVFNTAIIALTINIISGLLGNKA